ncbi:unnamed protein product, partial [Amoebophrya sp. A25]
KRAAYHRYHLYAPSCTGGTRACSRFFASRSTKHRMKNKLSLLRDPSLFASAKEVRIALIGRSNVGKSTLFNRLISGSAKSMRAIVHKRAGTTRDRLEGSGLIIHAIDTGGVEDVKKTVKSNILAQMRAQARQAMVEADVVLFLIDAKQGVTPLDLQVAKEMIWKNQCSSEGSGPRRDQSDDSSNKKIVFDNLEGGGLIGGRWRKGEEYDSEEVGSQLQRTKTTDQEHLQVLNKNSVSKDKGDKNAKRRLPTAPGMKPYPRHDEQPEKPDPQS